MHLVLCIMFENYQLIFSLDYGVPTYLICSIWLSVPKICGTEAEAHFQHLFHFFGSCSAFLGRCSTNCGTVPLCVGLLG